MSIMTPIVDTTAPNLIILRYFNVVFIPDIFKNQYSSFDVSIVTYLYSLFFDTLLNCLL
ncbi:protein of unknown function [Candidatus Nitrosocosmicus franklandus]|uniref:Uncharacterized protein n=1 Tax=Candidatus Nitrosocosmicus franklandianus TaxID=1798806 RepID=A0A484IAB2_9ARCH|nr:protein of unknown function [Candidatus Nitrosocosmicus franklandus]